MEIPWLLIFFTLTTIALALKFFLNSSGSSSNNNKAKLPPGPPRIPIFSDIQWLLRNPTDVERALIKLRSKYGPIVNLKLGNRNAVYIFNNDLAHKALVQNGAIFAERPPASESIKIISCNQHAISFASYGPLWRILRRNLVTEILNPSRIKSFSHSRKWVLNMLKNKLKSESESGKKPIQMVDHFQYAMFCLLAYLCFGDILGNDKVVREVEKAERDFAVANQSFHILSSLPPFLSKIVFRNLWSKLFKIRRNLETVYIPLIRARRQAKQLQQQQHHHQEDLTVSYVDALLNLTIPEEAHAKEEEEKGNGRRRKLKEEEIVSLCSEFLEGGIDTTTSALQWIMANLVKNQDIQEKLYNEVTSNTNSDDNNEKDSEIKEEDLHKMPYLKAVVLEGLRRHPPAHFLLAHTVTEDVTIGGYLVKKGSLVNFLVAEIGLDPSVWEDPMVFKPERFLSMKDGGAGDHRDGKDFDITGSREIKMLPFGAGRRICPGIGLATLHLEYFVANLVKDFIWTAREEDDVDLSGRLEQSIVLKYPLWVHVAPRN